MLVVRHADAQRRSDAGALSSFPLSVLFGAHCVTHCIVATPPPPHHFTVHPPLTLLFTTSSPVCVI